MQELPHHYNVAATAVPDGEVNLASDTLETIRSAPPKEFGGPGDRWSPETLLIAAVADCFILTFRAIAAASKLSWVSLRCEVEGTLDRKEGSIKFTEYLIRVTLDVPTDTDEAKAHRILVKTEAGCLVTNSLSGTTNLSAEVRVAPTQVPL